MLFKKPKIINEDDLLPAIPPVDYTGTTADWITALQVGGFLSDDEDFADIWLTQDEYIKILHKCEDNRTVLHPLQLMRDFFTRLRVL